VAAATLSAAEVLAARAGLPVRSVTVDGPHVVAAFRSERYLRAIGWTLPPLWDPVAGDFETKDGGWIRLHTNYPHHREAALRVLRARADRDAVARVVRTWDGELLEAAIVERGGCAARMRDASEWSQHPQGAAVASEPLVQRETNASVVEPAPLPPLRGAAPLEGIRVVDLTRVIAGPVATRFLAGYGADVVRVDPPRFEEGAGLVADAMAGKRRVTLNLREPDGRRAFEGLVADAHVLVCGYRGDALARLGYSPDELRVLRPGLVIASLDAYGWTGPWRTRRGFDSLVQMSCGIAARGADLAGTRRPMPLPAQALDHGTGYLFAAAICRALTRLISSGEVTSVRVSLARTAKYLIDLGETGSLTDFDFAPSTATPWMERAETPWGPVERVRCPGRLEGFTPTWTS
jgi:crotonobetainyl-CoA:carnitine CoA-transferase CaiB-like acyl-CoA transferase